MTKRIVDIQEGDLITGFPYGGPEALPVRAERVVRAQRGGYVILIGIDAKGNSLMVPLGHKSGSVEV